MTGCWWLILASRCSVPGASKSDLPGRRPTQLILLINIRSRHPKFGRLVKVDLPRTAFAVRPMHRISSTFYVQSAFVSASLIFRALTNRHVAAEKRHCEVLQTDAGPGTVGMMAIVRVHQREMLVRGWHTDPARSHHKLPRHPPIAGVQYSRGCRPQAARGIPRTH